MLRRTAAFALVALGSCFQQRFRNAFQGFAFVRIDRLRTLLLRSRFLGVRTFLKVLLSLIPLIITNVIIMLPLIVLFVFGFVIVVLVLFLQASLRCAADLFEQYFVFCVIVWCNLRKEYSILDFFIESAV